MDKPPISAHLAALLERQGMTAAQLSRNSGVGKGHISQLLSGRRPRPSAEVVCNLAGGLGVSMETLWTGEENPVSDLIAVAGRLSAVRLNDLVRIAATFAGDPSEK